MFAFLEPSIKFAIPNMVLTLAFVNDKSRIVCVVAQSLRNTSPSIILRSITHEFQIKLIKAIDNINNTVIDVITK